MGDKPSHDNVYAQPQSMIVDFAFDETVAKVFPDMIRRSVLGYETIISLIGLTAEVYAQADSHIYDLGCSLGAATLAMRRRIQQADCHIVAVDSSAAMVEKCQSNIADDAASVSMGVNVEVQCADIHDVEIKQASVVVLNFTLQFIQPEQRLELLKKIHRGMLAGGVLILSEKIDFSDEDEHSFHDSMHLAFKKANDYSELEISQKRSALEKVLIPETQDRHQQRLKQAGFNRSWLWFQCFNFASFIAFK